jgi:hypothetical protein
MRFNQTIGFDDPEKLSNFVRSAGKAMYSSSEDPASFEARTQLAEVLNTAFPNYSKEQAFKDYNHIIKSTTGWDVDAVTAMDDMKNTFNSSWNQMKAADTMYAAMMEGSQNDDYDTAVNSAWEKIEKLKTGYRTDYKDYSFITDSFMEASNIAPSTLKSVLIEGAGMVGGTLLGHPVAGLQTGRAVNALSVYRQEAGSLALELVDVQDEFGNMLDRNLITKAMQVVGTMNGIIEFGLDTGIQNIASSFTGKFGKKIVREAISNGTIRQWALKQLKEYGTNMGSEALTESLQELVTMFGGDFVKKQANKEGSSFDINAFKDYAKAVADTAVNTAKGMGVLSLAPGMKNAIADLTVGDPSYLLSANRFSDKTENTSPVPTAFVYTKGSKPDKETTKIGTPVKVIKVGNLYKPLDPEDAPVLAGLKNKGAKALNLEIVENTGDINDLSNQAAKNIATVLGASYKEDGIAFDSKEEAQEQAISYALGTDSVIGFTENTDGSYAVVREIEGNRHTITFADKAIIPDAKSVEKPMRQQQENPVKKTMLNATAGVLAKGTDQQSKHRFFDTMDKLSKTKSDRTFLERNVVNKVASSLVEQNPGMDRSVANDIGRSTAVWAKIVSNLSGMSAQEYYGQNFTKDLITIITPEMEKKLKSSKEFHDSVKADRKMNGKNGLHLEEDIRNRKVSGMLHSDTDGKTTIYLGNNADAVTVTHELAHSLVQSIQKTKKFDIFKELYATELTADGGILGINFQERFATDFETYLREGKARNEKVREAMKAITDAIKTLIGYVNRELDEKTRKAFDDLLEMGLVEKNHKPKRTKKKAIDAIGEQIEKEDSPDTTAEQIAKISNNQTGNERASGNQPRSNLFKVSNAIKEEQRQAVKDALLNHEYPSDSVLRQFAGDSDIDWEIQFRRIFSQDRQLVETFRDAYDQFIEEGGDIETESANGRILELLDAIASESLKLPLQEEIRNPERFIERMIWQERFVSPTDADNVFRHNLTEDNFLIEFAKTMTKGVDYAFSTNLSPHLFSLANKANPSGYSIRMARQEVRENLRDYRRQYLEKTGQTQQLSYEQAVEGTPLDNGTEAEEFANNEIRDLLSRDISPIVKSLIRKNLATGNTIQSLLDTLDEQVETYSDLLEKKDLTIEKLERILKTNEHKGKVLEGRYHELQDHNRYNYEQMRRYRRLYDTMKTRNDVLEIQNTLKRIESQIAKALKQNKQTDSKLMERANKVLSILKQSNGQELSSLFNEARISFEGIPQSLKSFFSQKGGKIFAVLGYEQMDLRMLDLLRKSLQSVKKEARFLKAQKDQSKRDRIFPVIQQYMMQAQGIDPETFDAYKDSMEQAKYEHGMRGTADAAKKGQPNSLLARFETQFLTMSRILRKIDGENGTALTSYFFGGIGVDGKLHKGIEGIIDTEKREEFRRYEAAREKMNELGITEKMLYSSLTDSGEKLTVDGLEISVDEAIGIYVYRQQQEGLRLLTSADGNRLTTDKIDAITGLLTQEQKAWGDWLIEDMGSCFDNVSEAYYRVKNKPLSMISKYFPLVRTGRNESFSDLMEDDYLNMQENAEDSMTHERTGGDFQLQLNATVIWNKMVAKQEHYIAGAEFFSDANYMMNKNGGDLFNLISMNSGTKYAQSVQDFINRVANKRNIQDDADSMVNAIRNNMIVARLGFNFLTALKQIPTLGLFLMEYGPVRFMESIAHITTHYQETTDFIYNLAPQLRNRNISIDYSSLSNMAGRNAYQRTVKQIGELGMTPIKWADNLVVNTLWYGAYQNNVAKGMDSEQAAMEATKWINDTQPGGTTKDSAAIYASNNSVMKFLLMFSNQLNKNMNIAYDIPYAIKQGMYEKAMRSAFGLGLSFAGIILLEGGIKNDGDDDKYLERILREFASQTASMMPIFGKELSDALSGRYYSDSGLPMISEGLSLVKALGTDDIERKIDKVIKFGLAGFELTGAPTGQVNKIWNALTKDEKINLGYLLGSDFAN